MNRRKIRESKGERRRNGVDVNLSEKPASSPLKWKELAEFAEAVVIIRLLIALLDALNI